MVVDLREERTARLAAMPLVPAGPQGGFVTGTASSVAGVWRYRQLLDLLVKRELKSRYKDSALGFAWSLLRPLAMLLVYYLAIGKFLGAERSIPSFAIYIFTGLTAWNLFNEIVTTGTSSIVSNGGLVKKIYVPREIFPLSVIGAALFNFVIQLAILFVATGIAREFPTGYRLLYLVAGTAVVLVWAAAWAFLLSAVNVYLRDVQYLVEIVLMVGFWFSPVVYAWKSVYAVAGSGVVGEIYLANPITMAIFAFQRAMWVAGSDEPQPSSLAPRLLIAFAVGVVVMWVGQRVFARLQANFAQEL